MSALQWIFAAPMYNRDRATVIGPDSFSIEQLRSVSLSSMAAALGLRITLPVRPCAIAHALVSRGIHVHTRADNTDHDTEYILPMKVYH